jgi:hypothetical protein
MFAECGRLAPSIAPARRRGTYATGPGQQGVAIATTHAGGGYGCSQQDRGSRPADGLLWVAGIDYQGG